MKLKILFSSLAAVLILAAVSVWLYRREAAVSESVSPNGRFRAAVTVQHHGWYLGSYDVHLRVFRGSQLALDRIIDNVDVPCDAEEAYGRIEWTKSGIKFLPTSQSVDVPEEISFVEPAP